MRGIPLSADRATFEAFEQRVEDAALDRYLAGHEEFGLGPEDCPRCTGLGSEPGTDDPCAACLGSGWL